MDKKHMFIAKDCHINGDVSSSGNVTIEGEFEGSINIQGDLIIGESGKIKGDIDAENVTVHGEVKGNIYAKGLLEISPKGVVAGDIKVKSLKIGQGAKFIGSSTHNDLTESEVASFAKKQAEKISEQSQASLEYKPIVYNRLAK